MHASVDTKYHATAPTWVGFKLDLHDKKTDRIIKGDDGKVSSTAFLQKAFGLQHWNRSYYREIALRSRTSPGRVAYTASREHSRRLPSGLSASISAIGALCASFKVICSWRVTVIVEHYPQYWSTARYRGDLCQLRKSVHQEAP